MFKKLYPKIRFDSTYDIDFKRFLDEGILGIIFDIDNTLVGHDAPSDDRCKELIEKLKNDGFSILILSNNREERVKSFADSIGCSYIFKAHKPSASGYECALIELDLPKDKVISVGDQLLTDIWGANNAGILSVLVDPLYSYEPFKIKIKRAIEKIVFVFYNFSLKRQGL